MARKCVQIAQVERINRDGECERNDFKEILRENIANILFEQLEAANAGVMRCEPNLSHRHGS